MRVKLMRMRRDGDWKVETDDFEIDEWTKQPLESMVILWKIPPNMFKRDHNQADMGQGEFAAEIEKRRRIREDNLKSGI